MFEQSVHSLLTSAPLFSARNMSNDLTGGDAVMSVKKLTSIAADSCRLEFIQFEAIKTTIGLVFRCHFIQFNNFFSLLKHTI